jgi:hypothetical protein
MRSAVRWHYMFWSALRPAGDEIYVMLSFAAQYRELRDEICRFFHALTIRPRNLPSLPIIEIKFSRLDNDNIQGQER